MSLPKDLDASLRKGYDLSHPEPGEDIVITGLSGKYPKSDNIHAFRDNLFDKIDLVSINPHFKHPEIPKRMGMALNHSKFDAAFFGVHKSQANVLDVLTRWCLEKTFEALLDAGISLQEIRGSKTAVIVGASYLESNFQWIFESPTVLGLNG